MLAPYIVLYFFGALCFAFIAGREKTWERSAIATLVALLFWPLALAYIPFYWAYHWGKKTAKE